MRELIHPGQLKGHRAAVVGAGQSGLAAARLLQALGADVRLMEKNPDHVDDVVQGLARDSGWDLRLGVHTSEDFHDVNLVVLSPGVSRRAVDELLAPSSQVVSEIELASWFVSAPMIGITGTNGKSTTTTLIGHVLSELGHEVFVGGNLGTPLSDYVLSAERAQYVVLEVSSFQLQNCNSFHPRVGILLNFSPNHLDYHQSIEEYFEAKLTLFARQTPKDLAVLPFVMKEVLEKRPEIKASRIYFVPRNRFSCPQLPGKHNQENMEAAFLACSYFGVDEQSFQRSLASYSSLPHRLQLVNEHKGVRYIDDSKATTVDALRVALEAMDKPVHLLAGGIFKGGDLTDLNPLIREKVKSVILFGGSRDIFEKAWGGLVEMVWTENIHKAVHEAAGRAEKGEIVLLSPATSSFDQFENYRERGRSFQEAVSNLTGEEKRQ